VDDFPTRWCTSTLGFGCSSVFGRNISKQVEWERWSDTLATTIAGYLLFFFLYGSTTLCRVLAFSTNFSFHPLLSCVRVFQFGTLSFCISFLISSIQRVFVLPLGLLEMGYQEYIAFTILVPCILSTWPSQPSLCARMKFITSIFLCLIISSSSWLVFIRHMPFSLIGPNIFLKIFLSNTNNLLIMVSFSIHVSHA